MEETKRLADEANALGTFDAIVHNAGVYHAPGQAILAVNTLAPYLLTCLIQRPGRLIYLSSGMHKNGNPDLMQMDPDRITYSDSKLHDVFLAKAVARLWPGVRSNAVDPGWVPTKMGGSGAPGNLTKGFETQTWLAVGEEAGVSGRYFFHKKEAKYHKAADNVELQNRFLERCGQLTGVSFPLR
jgi:NAD(P)-dependent dehydrogenase (short-subunit alcohol dehydrogenase family)